MEKDIINALKIRDKERCQLPQRRRVDRISCPFVPVMLAFLLPLLRNASCSFFFSLDSRDMLSLPHLFFCLLPF